jgi:hypothetical protein
MKLNWDSGYTSKPLYYARQIIKALGITHPPVDEKVIADFRGYKILPITKEDIDEWPNPKIGAILKTASAHIFPEDNLIAINGEDPHTRQRTHSFHELGHEVYPLHSGQNFSCSESDLNLITHKKIESEAFLCGGELQLPSELLLDDILSMETGKKALKVIASSYDASIEVTALKYTRIHPGLTAIIVAEPITAYNSTSLNGYDHTFFSDYKFTPLLDKKQKWFTNRDHLNRLLQDGVTFSMQIRYSQVSDSFPKKFFIPGTPIPDTSPIYKDVFLGNKSWKGELPVTDFGSSRKGIKYYADCFPIGLNGDRKVMALLWLDDNQLKFWRK